MYKKASQKDIEETQYDIVPLDKLIPLKTVTNCFERDFKKTKDYFGRSSQRLREIYFSIFACRALDILEKKEHFLVFHKDQGNNDVSFVSSISTGGEGFLQEYDIKEYHPKDKNSINDFFKRVLEDSRYKSYNLVIGLHNRDGKLSLKIDFPISNKWIILVSAVSEKDENVYRANVKIFSSRGIYLDENIDLSEYLDVDGRDVIFHDKIKFR